MRTVLVNKYFICILAIILLFIFFIPKISNAQETSFGISNSLPIVDKQVKDGDIVTVSSKGYTLSKTSYDPSMIGVVSLIPAVAINIEGIGKTYPVIIFGSANVRVSSVNGEIKKGDLITTSEISGVGMRAEKSGYVLGSALTGYNSKNPAEIGKIPIALNVYYFYSRPYAPKAGILDILNMSALATYEQPSLFLKYLIAAIILLVSIVFGFFSFARTASKSIEALGRNPLAGKSIQFGMLVNAFIAIIIVLAGVAIAYIVIIS